MEHEITLDDEEPLVVGEIEFHHKRAVFVQAADIDEDGIIDVVIVGVDPAFAPDNFGAGSEVLGVGTAQVSGSSPSRTVSHRPSLSMTIDMRIYSALTLTAALVSSRGTTAPQVRPQKVGSSAVGQPVERPAPSPSPRAPAATVSHDRPATATDPAKPLNTTLDSVIRERGSPVPFDRVFAEMQQIPRFKDEFEPLSEFQERQAAARAKCAPLYLIETPVDLEYVRYDADKQVLLVAIYALLNTSPADGELISMFGWGSELHKGGHDIQYSTLGNVLWAFPREERDIGTYTGSNAFGATAEIMRQEGVARGVFEREGKYSGGCQDSCRLG